MGNPKKCSQCGNYVIILATLKSHVIIHRGEGSCLVTVGSLKNVYNVVNLSLLATLKSHLIIHSCGETSYMCTM